jgi:hypothetical protein
LNFDEFGNLTEREKEEFQRIANDLLSSTFILKDTWSVRDNRLITNQAYLFVERNFQLFRQMFNLLGWDIHINDFQGYIEIVNPFATNRARLNMFQTYFLYTLRFIYEDKKNDISLSRGVTCSVREVILRMTEVFHLADKRPGKSHIDDTVQTLKNFRIVEAINLSGEELDRTLIIYPTIYSVVSNEKIMKVRQELAKISQKQELNIETEEEGLND